MTEPLSAIRIGIMSLEMANHNQIRRQQEASVDTAEPRFMDEIAALRRQGAAAIAARWMKEYEAMDPRDSASFFERFDTFVEQREDALFSLEIPHGLDERLAEQIKQFDKNIKLSFGNASLFQGNGGTAEVYEVLGHPSICVKFITNQEQYNESNHLRTEFNLLNSMRGLRVGRVRTPNPYFLRIHPRDGHSYGMEKIKGKSLSQITEKPYSFPELVAVAKGLDRNQVLDELMQFVKKMHSEKGVTHGDLFERNLMLDNTGNLFVIDFGKGKRYESDDNVRDMQEGTDLAIMRSSVLAFFAKIDKM